MIIMIFIYKTFSYTLFPYLKQTKKLFLWSCIHTCFQVICHNNISYMLRLCKVLCHWNHLTMPLSWSRQEMELMSLQHCSIRGSKITKNFLPPIELYFMFLPVPPPSSFLGLLFPWTFVFWDYFCLVLKGGISGTIYRLLRRSTLIKGSCAVSTSGFPEVSYGFPLLSICPYRNHEIALKHSLNFIWHTSFSPPLQLKVWSTCQLTDIAIHSSAFNGKNKFWQTFPSIKSLSYSLGIDRINASRIRIFFLGTLLLPAIYLTDYAFYYHVNCFRLQGKKKVFISPQ